MRILISAVLLTLAGPSIALAQDATPSKPSRWSLEIYGGGRAETQSTSGGVPGPVPQLPTFTTVDGYPSWRVPSYRFGDGSLLLNEVMAAIGQDVGRTLPRIQSIDSLLAGPGSRSGAKPTFGLRLVREMTSGWYAELSVERNNGGLGVDGEMLASLESAGASFVDTFSALLAEAPATDIDVESTVSSANASQSQLRVLGAVRRTLASSGRFTFHATAGGGFQNSGGTAMNVTIRGNYSFSPFDDGFITERDDLVIRFKDSPSGAVGFLGLSAEYAVAAKTAFRLDIRGQLSPNRVVTEVEALPTGTNTAAQIISSLTSPAIQISNATQPQSTLARGERPKFTTFEGKGMNRQFLVTLGVVMKF